MKNPSTATNNVVDNEDDSNMFRHRQDHGNGYHHSGSSSQSYDSSQYPYRQQRSNQNQFHYFDEQGDKLNMNFTGNYGILVAILVVGLYQFRGPIISWLRPFWGMSPMEIVMELWDYSRAYMRMGIEVLRNLRFLLTSSTGILVGDDVDELARSRSANANNNNDNDNNHSVSNNNNNGKTKRRRRFRDAASAFSAMPELEDDPALVGATGNSNSQHQSRLDTGDKATNGNGAAPRKTLRSGMRPRSKNDDIEPAFLKEEDYPPGWLVYHPVLGVVPKTEADRYPREEEVIRRRKAI